MKKQYAAAILAAVMTVGNIVPSFAGQWQWQDVNGDGISECYYYDDNGIMLTNTTTPDGYTVDSNGAWVVNGVVQTQSSRATSTTVNHNAGYDPAHPLAGKIDEWNLRLPSNTLTGFSICSASLQALLPGQMDYYNYLDIANYGTLVDGVYVGERNGSTFYVTEEDYIKGKQEDQQLYNWFCNWVNGMDFENMSEMDKAK